MLIPTSVNEKTQCSLKEPLLNTEVIKKTVSILSAQRILKRLGLATSEQTFIDVLGRMIDPWVSEDLRYY